MKGIKFISGFAVCGFLLSFLFGLFSHTSFISILLKALLFCVIFGILGFLISLIFEKFLADDSGDFSGDYSSDENSGVKSSSPNSKGQLVDITISDEELEKSEGDNHFLVGDNHQMLSESDIAQKNEPKNDGGTQGFVPLRNVETLKDLSGKEAVSPAMVSNESAAVISDSSNENIDTLPDMNNMSFASEDDNESEEEVDTNTDSDFVVSANAHKNSGEVPEIKDAALMAKAISSVLSDENSL